eukprot:11026901-Prorocentrum_lima.AAC.1
MFGRGKGFACGEGPKGFQARVVDSGYVLGSQTTDTDSAMMDPLPPNAVPVALPPPPPPPPAPVSA